MQAVMFGSAPHVLSNALHFSCKSFFFSWPVSTFGSEGGPVSLSFLPEPLFGSTTGAGTTGGGGSDFLLWDPPAAGFGSTLLSTGTGLGDGETYISKKTKNNKNTFSSTILWFLNQKNKNQREREREITGAELLGAGPISFRSLKSKEASETSAAIRNNNKNVASNGFLPITDSQTVLVWKQRTQNLF